MSSYLIEKSVIGASLLAGFPLFLLDKDLFPSRRFGWLVASCAGLASLLFVGATNETDDPELSILLDKVTVAAICVTAIPHFIQLIKDSLWVGIAVVPPIFLVIHLSTTTPVGSEAYWRLRCFLHMAIFFIPYLNHLPGDEATAKSEEEIQIVTTEETTTPPDKDEADASKVEIKGRAKTNKKKKS